MLRKHVFRTLDEILSAIERILTELDESTLITVFHDCIRRLELCIDTHGEYVQRSERLSQIAFIFIQEIVRC
jgi:hypothetical protein